MPLYGLNCPECCVSGGPPQTIGAVAEVGCMINAAYYAFTNGPVFPCKFYRTATTRLVDTQGPPTVVFETVITSKVEYGNSGFVASGGGPDPCPSGTLQGDGNAIHVPSLTQTYARTRDGTIGAVCGGFNFNGYIESQFSDEVLVSDIEAAAQVLAAQADWGPVQSNTGDRAILWDNQQIITIPANPPSRSLYFCTTGTPGMIRGSGNASLVSGTSGGGGFAEPTGSPIIYAKASILPIFFASGWVMQAFSWQSRVSPTAPWCRINGTIQRVAGFPGQSDGCNPVTPAEPAFGCTRTTKTQEPVPGTYIITPGSAPMQFTNVGFGNPTVCA